MLLLLPFIDRYGAWIRRERTDARGSIEGGLLCINRFPLNALFCWATDGMNDAGTRMKKKAMCKVVFLVIIMIFSL